MELGTKVYGVSDDLIEFDGDIHGEVNHYGTDDQDDGVLLVFSDGTLLEVKYGKSQLGIWEIRLIRAGRLYDKIDRCENEDAEIHSDVAYFKKGLTYCFETNDWARVK